VRFGREGSIFYAQWKGPKSEDFGALGLAVRFAINVAALWLAQFVIRGFDINSLPALIFGAIIFGAMNAFLKPIVSMISCALTCATLGLFALIINTAMLALTAWVAGFFDLSFRVDGFTAAFLGALVISIVSTILGGWADRAILRPARRDALDDW
jgi:putative membrane protein